MTTTEHARPGACSICGKTIEPGQLVSHVFTASGEARRHATCALARTGGRHDDDDGEGQR